ncbi:sensor histidine kinase [Agromyces mediolanus]|uniref:sensor histidine kinase n=1 Tax=Agromyces mediolanus TaxID=41986 RepID=UPI003832549F
MPVPPWDDPAARRGPPAAVVLLVPVVLSLLVQLPAAIGIALWTATPPAAAALQIGLAAAGGLALLASRRWPGPTVVLVAALALAAVLTGPDVGPPYLALAFAVVLAIVRGAAVWAASAVGVAWVAAVALGPVTGHAWSPFRIAAATAGLGLCFAVGWFVRRRRERASAFRDAMARRRRTAEERERVRIARELHDVLGHALSQINVQASVGLHLMDRDPEQARSALASIKGVSKTALEEVRSVLGVLREGEAPLAPQAELAQLPRLVAEFAVPGLDARIDDRLGEALPARPTQFAAYRIAQEALTNVARHAEATEVVLRLERDGDAFVLTVDDDGIGLTPAVDEATTGAVALGDGLSAGRGILGMRERAALLGGAVAFEASPLGGTRIVARLPWGALR